MRSASEEVQDRENIFSLVQECVDINCDDSITIAGELWAVSWAARQQPSLNW